jgi:hypothetical protein
VACVLAAAALPIDVEAQRLSLGRTGGNGREGNQGVTLRTIELRVPCTQGCRFALSLSSAIGSEAEDLYLERVDPSWIVVSGDGQAAEANQVTISSGPNRGDASGSLSVYLSVAVIGDTEVEPDETIEIRVENLRPSSDSAGPVSYTLKAGKIVNDDGIGGAGEPERTRPLGRVLDFNRDGRSDVLWHNTATRESQIWYMNAAARTGRATVGVLGGGSAIPDAPWTIVGAGDFDNDGESDILWHNDVSRETQIWYMNGASRSGRATVELTPGVASLADAPWRIASTGDFNGDGRLDILWQNSASRETAIWYMNGATRTGRATVTAAPGGAPALADAPWKIVGTGDFNLDGQTDILWHNPATRETAIWYLSGASRTSRATVGVSDAGSALADVPWTIVGAGDFNQDGHVDILWHNDATRETAIWYMTGALRTGREFVTVTDEGPALVTAPWTIVNR